MLLQKVIEDWKHKKLQLTPKSFNVNDKELEKFYYSLGFRKTKPSFHGLMQRTPRKEIA